jgi:hypothetical protein
MGPLTAIIWLRLLALAAGRRHNAETGQPWLCFSGYRSRCETERLPEPDPSFETTCSRPLRERFASSRRRLRLIASVSGNQPALEAELYATAGGGI